MGGGNNHRVWNVRDGNTMIGSMRLETMVTVSELQSLREGFSERRVKEASKKACRLCPKKSTLFETLLTPKH